MKYFIENLPITMPYYTSLLMRRNFWDVTIEGFTVKLSFSTPLHHHIAKEEHNHFVEYELLRKWITLRGSVVYDIGGYNGIYGLLYAKSHPYAEVTIFEPDDINAEHIDRNIDLNGLKNCRLLRAAVTDHDGTVSFSQGGRSKEHMRAGGKMVKAVTLATLPKADLIKIDAEGAEGRILSALKYQPTILLELHEPSFLNRYGDTEEVVWGFVRALNRELLFDRQSEKHYLLTP